MKILFLHGWHSVPGGAKPTYLNQHGHEVSNPALPDDQFADAVQMAQAEFEAHQPDVIVGSSRGGAVAMAIDSGDTPLVLLCPAWKRWRTTTTVKRGTTILHSRNDETIPFADSQELIRISGLPEAALIETGNDHRLADAASLRAMLKACLAARPRLIGCDFGVPKKAGDQANKIILIEAVKVGAGHYAVEPSGRNTRLVHTFTNQSAWKARRRGWTLPDLVASLSADPFVKLAGFDFPFSLPLALLRDTEFARLMNQPPFESRDGWSAFVSGRLRLAFDDDSAGAELRDLAHFAPWKNQRFWLKRATDVVTNGSPPLKHKFQNVFAMTIAGSAFLRRLNVAGYSTLLDSAIPTRAQCVVETYPRAVANRLGVIGGYKTSPHECLQRAMEFIRQYGIRIDFDENVRHFCETYRTADNDPDGADAFLCLIAAISCAEGIAELCCSADAIVVREEGAIIAPKRLQL